MDNQLAKTLMFEVVKIIFTAAGTFIVYLGYKLFQSGLFTESGEINASFGDKNIAIKKAAPGTFFVLFGAIIILLNIQRASLDDTTKTIEAEGEIHDQRHADSIMKFLENKKIKLDTTTLK